MGSNSVEIMSVTAGKRATVIELRITLPTAQPKKPAAKKKAKPSKARNRVTYLNEESK